MRPTQDVSLDELNSRCEAARDEAHRWQTLAAVVSHEIRHPLHVMRLALARHFPRGDEQPRLVLERYIDRIARVLGDLNDLVRIEQDALVLQRTWLDLTQLLREVVDAYAPDAATRHVKLTLEGAVSPSWIEADEQRLLQVLSNVIDNALKFTPAGGTVLVALTSAPGRLDVRVRDTGAGIRPEFLPHVFDLYASASSARGLGVGLTVARRIIELHEGAIEVTSEGEDRGTEVVITLPSPIADGQTVATYARRAMSR